MFRSISYLFFSLFFFYSCKGQTNAKAAPEPPDSTTTTTTPLDTSLMISKTAIRAILQDKAGNFWFATDGEGVCKYDGKSFKWFTKKDGLSTNQVWTITEDKAGNLWFCSQRGVCRYDGKTIKAFDEKHSVKTGLDKVIENKTANIGFGSHDGENLYNGKTFTYFTIHPPSYHREPYNWARPYAVYCMLQDKAGNLWFGTEQMGICKYDGQAFTYFTENGLAGTAVRNIYEDKDGKIWFATNGNGLIYYDGKSVTNFTEQKGLGNPDFAKTLKGKLGTLARVWTVMEDNSGNLWFGTIDAGLWKYDGNKLTNYTTKDGLTSNAIWTIYKDKSGTLWIGTADGSVCKYDGKAFTHFTNKGTFEPIKQTY